MNVSEEILGIYTTSPAAQPTASEMASILGRPVPSIRRTLNNLVGREKLGKFVDDEGLVRFKLSEDDTKTCPKCGETKNLQVEFGFRGKTVQSWCRSCRGVASRWTARAARAFNRTHKFRVGQRVYVYLPENSTFIRGELIRTDYDPSTGNGSVEFSPDDPSKFCDTEFRHLDGRIHHKMGWGLVAVREG